MQLRHGLMIMVVVSLMTCSVTAQVTVTPYQQIQYEMCGAGWVALAITEIESYDTGWRAASSHGDIINVAASRLFVSIMDDGISKVFPIQAIIQFLDKFHHQSVQYGDVYVDANYTAPTGCSVVGSNIECNPPPDGKSLVLFAWNFVVFSDTEETADETGDFDALDNGTYVVGYGDEGFVTTYLTVSN